MHPTQPDEMRMHHKDSGSNWIDPIVKTARLVISVFPRPAHVKSICSHETILIDQVS